MAKRPKKQGTAKRKGRPAPAKSPTPTLKKQRKNRKAATKGKGRRGPAKTPTAILKLRGSWRGDVRQDEPQPIAEIPRKPKDLTGEAGEAWKVLTPKLQAMKVLGTIDRNALTRYCLLWVQWKDAADFLKKNGLVRVVKNRKGKITGCVAWPHVGILDKLSIQLLRLEKEFGMTPSARAGMTISAPPPPDEKRGKLKLG